VLRRENAVGGGVADANVGDEDAARVAALAVEGADDRVRVSVRPRLARRVAIVVLPTPEGPPIERTCFSPAPVCGTAFVSPAIGR
jgi:hypothetical protein